MRSRVAVGAVAHRRHDAVAHAFAHRVGWLLIDLAEAPAVLARGWWCGWRRPALTRFHRGDHLAGADDLATAVRDLVERRTGERPDGRIELLTTPRMAGVAFNPVSFYLCRDRADRLRHVAFEITNTPWRERHAYVVGPLGEDGAATHAKTFHVSPFQPLGQVWRWRFAADGERVRIAMRGERGGRTVFSAALALALAPATPRRLARHLARHPLAALRTLARIHRQAFALWRRGAPFHPHPGRHAPTAPAVGAQAIP